MLPLAALALASALQCTDPSVPPGGFLLEEQLDVPVTFSDGETTTASLRWPRDNPGPCGWPVLIFIHGLFGAKSGQGPLARDFAQAGYFTLTFDVRGHASASGMHTLWGQRERFDLVELVRWAQASYPGIVDPERLALTGASQGAILSFSAAAWGGRPIEPNPWLSGDYPQVDAVVVENLTADFLQTFAPQSLGMHCNVAAAMLGSNDVRFDFGLVADASRAVLDNDQVAWSALMGDPSRNPRSLVPTMATPVLAMSAWDDFWFPVSALVDTFAALPAGVPRKLYLGAGGHSTPSNDGERALRQEWRRKWFDRFLKGEPNGIDSAPRIVYAETPADVAAYLDPQSTWVRRETGVWPPEGTRPYRLYLREGGHLWPFEPTADEPDDLLVQTVSGSFGPAELIAAEFRLSAVEAEIERHALSWESAVLAAPLRFAGDPVVDLTVSSPIDRWQLCVSLWDLAPNGDERYVTSGSHFSVAPNAALTPTQISVRLDSQAYEFPAGHRIALRVGNMHVHEPPTGALLRYAPTLSDFAVSVLHDDIAPSWLELPVNEALPISYGWSQIASNGCVASATASGTATATPSAPFEVRAEQVIGQRDGLLIYGLGARKSFLSGGFLWVEPPVRRSPILHSGGTPGANNCSGVLSYDFNLRIQSGSDPSLLPGTRVFAQFWYRDPASTWTTNLTNAVEFSIFP